MLEIFLEFWSLSDPNVVWVLSGAILLAMSAAVIGSFAVLQQRALTGDALAHAALPGVTTAFLFFHTRSPIVLLVGAVLSCLIGYGVIEYLVKNTRIKQDSALAIVLSLFFAFGIFQLTYIQKLEIPGQSGLDKILFGQAASLVGSDVLTLSIIAVCLLIFVVLCFEKLKLITFDRDFARALGVHVGRYEFALALALVLSVVIGLQLVGVVLMAAMIMTPAAAARYWTDDLTNLVVIAAVFGAVSGIAGANISYMAPQMPTGPWMVVVISLLFAISLFCAPLRGILPREVRRKETMRRIERENVLRTLYKIYESQAGGVESDTVESEKVSRWVQISQILQYRSMVLPKLERCLLHLVRGEFLLRDGASVSLTPRGLARARELTRFHRLWETYLTEKVRLPSDHVHDDAEEMEHVLTGELANLLIEELDIPARDPHGSVIPEAESLDGEEKE